MFLLKVPRYYIWKVCAFFQSSLCFVLCALCLGSKRPLCLSALDSVTNTRYDFFFWSCLLPFKFWCSFYFIFLSSCNAFACLRVFYSSTLKLSWIRLLSLLDITDGRGSCIWLLQHILKFVLTTICLLQRFHTWTKLALPLTDARQP